MDRDLFQDRNQRSHERIDISLPCTVNTPGGEPAEAAIVSLSMGGLRLACNRETYEQLLPPDQHIPGQLSDVKFEVRFALRAANNRNMTIRTMLLGIHTLRHAQDQYEIGARFIALAKTDSNRLENFISDLQDQR